MIEVDITYAKGEGYRWVLFVTVGLVRRALVRSTETFDRPGDAHRVGCEYAAAKMAEVFAGVAWLAEPLCILHHRPLGPPPAQNCPECRDSIDHSLRPQ